MKKTKKNNSAKVSWLFILGIVIASVCFYFYLSQSVSETSKTEVKITFLRGNRPAVVKRNTTLQESTTTVTTAKAVMCFLIAGPSNVEKLLGIYSEIPKAAKVINITQDADVLILNLSPEFFEENVGAASIQSALLQIVFTLTELKDINKVRFLIEGKSQEIVIGGEGLVIDGPIGREDLNF